EALLERHARLLVEGHVAAGELALLAQELEAAAGELALGVELERALEHRLALLEAPEAHQRGAVERLQVGVLRLLGDQLLEERQRAGGAARGEVELGERAVDVGALAAQRLDGAARALEVAA